MLGTHAGNVAKGGKRTYRGCAGNSWNWPETRHSALRGIASCPPEAVVPLLRIDRISRRRSASSTGAAVEALMDRLIPPDPNTPGGKDTGCAVFIDRQLAGALGRRAGSARPIPSARNGQSGQNDSD